MKFNIVVMALLALTISGCKSSQKAGKEKQTPLCGVQWNLTYIDGQLIDSTSYMTQPHIVFMEDGSFSGNFGCNTFFGNYYVKKQKMELTYQGATKKLCPNMTMEREMMKALKKQISGYEIFGKTLVLYEGKDEVMRFEDSGVRIQNEQ